MARIRIPKNTGEFRIVSTGGNGSHIAVADGKIGHHRILIPCRDMKQALKLLKKLSEKDHNGEIWV